jgi:hypothetical protein
LIPSCFSFESPKRGFFYGFTYLLLSIITQILLLNPVESLLLFMIQTIKIGAEVAVGLQTQNKPHRMFPVEVSTMQLTKI